MNQKLDKFREILNEWGKERKAFFFLIDFEKEAPFVCPLEELQKHLILLKMPNFRNYTPTKQGFINDFQIFPVTYEEYKKSFDFVQQQINYGNSYLVNLTFPAYINTDYTLEQIFYAASSPYKLFFKNKFVSFSPESFIKIADRKIYSFPMKGTIDASISDARKIILEDEKEKREHYTIVDLIRNDLSMVAEKVQVSRFRYIQEIKTSRKHLYQVSSEIQGDLPENWQENIGNILLTLLPAGSISGAPKEKTIEIIQQAEKDKRGYYTGIFGIFDGKNLDSAVNIRFIEERNNFKIYRSGGGITSQSNPKSEYNELIDKIYVPIDGNH